MILLDAHVWLWWVNQSEELPASAASVLIRNYENGLAISAISCWEVAKKSSVGKLSLSEPVDHWIRLALDSQGITCLPIGSDIAVRANQLPGEFHNDPADQIIVATAIIHDLPLLTLDEKILAYPHVKLL